MSYRPVPNHRQVKVAQLAHPCPEAAGRSRTRQPRARLDRWQILRDLVVDRWSNPDEGVEAVLARHLSALSPLERDLVRRMFLNIERMLPFRPDVELGLEGSQISFDDDDAAITTSVHLTFSMRHPDGTSEHLRLKTGRSPSTAEEAAVIWAGAEESETFADIMAWPGEVEPIEAPDDLESRLRHLVENSPTLTGGGVRPGPQCVWCPRTAMCGAYPAPRAVPTNARTVNLTKTDVEGLDLCHRRVAWRRVHGIPRDDGDGVEVGDVVSQGRMFHSLVAVAHESDDPDAAVIDYLRGVPPSEVADLQTMWDNHRKLLAEDGLALRKSEFPVGVTLLDGDRTQPHGVTLIAFIDLTGRQSDGQPVAVEIKTGNPAPTDVEDDLYAVGMQRWLADDQSVVIHRHHVRLDPPRCEVVSFDTAGIDAATGRLRRRVQPVAGWDWDDPLQPGFSVGGWCTGCEYRLTCESYRETGGG